MISSKSTWLVLALFSLVISCRFFEQATPGTSSKQDFNTRLGEGEGAEDSSDAESSDKVIVVLTVADLPACDENTVNQVYYVQSSKEFFVCGFDGSEYGFQPMDIDANDLLLQNCASENLLQESEEITVGDATCSEGLGGVQITLGCDINTNGILDVDANPNEISGSKRNICNVTAPPQTTANMSLLVSSSGSDSANCQTSSPCLTFATAISKVPKTINHTVTLSVQAGMTLTEQLTVQGFTIGGNGTLRIASTNEGSNWTVDGEDTRDYAIKVEGVSGTGNLVLHDVTVTNANLAGLYIDSSVTSLGKITADSNGSTITSAGILIDNASRVNVLAGGPYDIVINGNAGDGLRISTSSEVTLESLTVTSNGNDGIQIISDAELTVSALTEISGSGSNGIEIDDSHAIINGATTVDPANNSGGALVSTSTVGATKYAFNVKNGAELELNDIRGETTTATAIAGIDNAKLVVVRGTFNGGNLHGVNAVNSSTLIASHTSFSNNTGSGIRLNVSTARLNEGSSEPIFIKNNGAAGATLSDTSIMSLSFPYDVQSNGPAGALAVDIQDTTSIFSRTTEALPGTLICEDGLGGKATGCDAGAGSGDVENYCTGPVCANPQP